LARAVLEEVRSKRLDLTIVGLISDRPAPALTIAEEFGYSSWLVDYRAFGDRRSWSIALEERIDQCAPDLVVSLGFMRILSSTIVNRFPIINTHPALLPLFPGAHAVRDALAAGASETGTTVHWVDEGVDTGEVISQISVGIEPGDTEELLHERIKIQERALIVETLHRYAEGTLARVNR
jgi:phosphoribosylglycinamide formyltransferase-1